MVRIKDGHIPHIFRFGLDVLASEDSCVRGVSPRPSADGVRRRIQQAWRDARCEMERAWFEGQLPKLVPRSLQREMAGQWYGALHRAAERMRRRGVGSAHDPELVKIRSDAHGLLERRLKDIQARMDG